MAFGGITGKSTTNWTNEEILSATTAQSLGLSAGATPDEAFKILNENFINNTTSFVTGIFVLPAGSNTTQRIDITLGFRPKIVFIFNQNNDNNQVAGAAFTESRNSYLIRIIVDGFTFHQSEITDDGFYFVSSLGIQTQGYYIAFR